MQYNLVFSTDKNYLPYLFVLCQSIVDNVEQRESNPQDELVFNVLIDDTVDIDDTNAKAQSFTERNQGCGIHFTFNLHLVDINLFNKFNSMVKEGNTSFSTYYRVMLDKFLPDDVHYAAYLDIDMLVLTDIRNLFDNHPLTGKLIGAVIDPGVDNYNPPAEWTDPYMYGKYKNNQSQTIKIPKKNYFNGGLLLINLNEWRKQNISAKCLELASQIDLQFHDQDLLNYICQGQVELLDVAWNFQAMMFYTLYNRETNKYDVLSIFTPEYHWQCQVPDIEEFERASTSPYIVHFTGQKPWWTTNFHCCLPRTSPKQPTDKLKSYLNKWWSITKRVEEYSLHQYLNLDAVSCAELDINKLLTDFKRYERKIKKFRKILYWGLLFLVLLNLVTLFMLLTH